MSEAQPRGPVELSRSATAAVTATYVLFAATATAYGPLVEVYHHIFRLSVARAGTVVTAHALGSLLGTGLALLTLERLPGRAVLRLGLLASALGCALVAISSTWTLVVTGSAVIGVGFGCLDLACTHVVARTDPVGRAARLNLVNIGFGVGAILAPAAFAAAGPGGYRWAYAGLAAVAGCVGVALRGVVAPPEVAARPLDEGATAGWVHRAGLSGLVGWFIVAMGCYVGVEVTVGGFAAAYLVHHGWSLRGAGIVASGFFAGMVVGRAIAVPAAHRFTPALIVLASTAACVATVALMLLPAVAALAVVATGVACGPVFPTAVAWLTDLDPHNPRGLSWLLVAAAVGGVVASGTVGLTLAWVGFVAVPAVLLVLALASGAAFLAVARSTRRPAALPAVG